MSAIVDTYITYRIITTLTKDWDEQDAYKYGIIDKKGKREGCDRKSFQSKRVKEYNCHIMSHETLYLGFT